MTSNRCCGRIEINTWGARIRSNANAQPSLTSTSSGPGCIRHRLAGAECLAPPARAAWGIATVKAIGPGRRGIAIRSRIPGRSRPPGRSPAVWAWGTRCPPSPCMPSPPDRLESCSSQVNRVQDGGGSSRRNFSGAFDKDSASPSTLVTELLSCFCIETNSEHGVIFKSSPRRFRLARRTERLMASQTDIYSRPAIVTCK